MTGAGRCNGTYKWSDRVNRRSCYKSPSGCVIYYNEQDNQVEMPGKPIFLGNGQADFRGIQCQLMEDSTATGFPGGEFV